MEQHKQQFHVDDSIGEDPRMGNMEELRLILGVDHITTGPDGEPHHNREVIIQYPGERITTHIGYREGDEELKEYE